MDDAIEPGGVRIIEATALDRLFTSLHDAGYRVIGPTVRDGAIILGELETAGNCPSGWGVRLEPGGYRLRRRSDGAAFGHSAGPGSWSSSCIRHGRSSGPPAWPTAASRSTERRVRTGTAGASSAADLRAIQIQDRATAAGTDPRYGAAVPPC